MHELAQLSTNGRPLIVQNRETHGIAGRIVRGDTVCPQYTLELSADPRDCCRRTRVTRVCVKANTKRMPLFECMREHEKFDLRVDYRSDCRSSQPRVANLAGIDARAAMTRMACRPRPTLQIPEACGPNDHAVTYSHDGERHRSSSLSRGDRSLDVLRDCARALRHGTPLIK
jgi:hypothetical protein